MRLIEILLVPIGFPYTVSPFEGDNMLTFWHVPTQVLAYSLGLGTLVQDEMKLRLHMKAELDHNDSPYGLLVVTGMN